MRLPNAVARLIRLVKRPDLRSEIDAAGAPLVRLGEYDLDRKHHQLLCKGRSVPLPPKALDLLDLLVSRSGALVTRLEIAAVLWESNPPADVDAGINTLVLKIRRALDREPGNGQWIQSVTGRGYRYVGPLQPVGAARYSAQITWRIASLLALAALGVALTTNAYAAAIEAFWLAAFLLMVGYPWLTDTPFTRLGVGLFLLATMGYTLSASTLPAVVANVVNMATLGPAVVYPMVTGLKFIPSFVLILGVWVLARVEDDAGFFDRPGRRKGYVLFGTLFLMLTLLAIAFYSGDYRIWEAGLPGRWTILVGYLLVFSINGLLAFQGFRFFNQPLIASYGKLWGSCAVAYLLLVAPATLIDGEYNRINRHYLDKRRTEIYVAANADALSQFRAPLEANLREKVGPDLLALLSDPKFSQVLRNGRFYRQDFDEAFQISGRAVMYGYKAQPRSAHDRPEFTIIRFPDELARSLRFQAVGAKE